MKSSNINTNILLVAIDHYKMLGYRLIDVPCIVALDVSQFTKPSGRKEFYHSDDKVYVASAEQSFLQLIKDGKNLSGKFMALTQCIRDEDIHDDTHLLCFLKLELINVGTDCYNSVLNDSYSFMSLYSNCVKVKTADGVDIEINGIEVGSYGTRKYKDVDYVYGTGIALPRFSYAVAKSD